MRITGQVLRLDLYRLICYFRSSEYIVNLLDGDDFCPIARWNRSNDMEFAAPFFHTGTPAFISGTHQMTFRQVGAMTPVAASRTETALLQEIAKLVKL